MQITRKSILSGIVRTREIDITPGQFAAWQQGLPIQDVAPHLSADDREFVMTGITPDEWEAAFGPVEEPVVEIEIDELFAIIRPVAEA